MGSLTSEYYKSHPECKVGDCYEDRPYYFSEDMIHIEAESNNGKNKLKELNMELNIINISLWSSFIIGLVGYYGIILYRSNTYNLFGRILLLLSASLIIFSVIAFYYSVAFIIDMNLTTQFCLEDISPEYGRQVTFGYYNYFYLVIATLLLYTSIIHLFLVGKFVRQYQHTT